LNLLPHFEVMLLELNEESQQILIFQVVRKQNHEFPELSESKLFRAFCLKKLKPSLAIDDIKEALDNLDDPRFLAESKLNETHYIYSKNQSDENLNSTERGLLVRDFLKEGFERLRPSGEPDDKALIWRTYNILYHYHFKSRDSSQGQGLRVQQTMTHLNIMSTRQFHRELQKAYLALLQELLELERISLARL